MTATVSRLRLDPQTLAILVVRADRLGTPIGQAMAVWVLQHHGFVSTDSVNDLLDLADSCSYQTYRNVLEALNDAWGSAS